MPEAEKNKRKVVPEYTCAQLDRMFGVGGWTYVALDRTVITSNPNGALNPYANTNPNK